MDNPKTCPRSELCVTRDLWDEVKEAISGVLESVTLQDLVERQRQKVLSQRQAAVVETMMGDEDCSKM